MAGEVKIRERASKGEMRCRGVRLQAGRSVVEVEYLIPRQGQNVDFVVDR
jgi:hypothetical protein